jgi:acetyltransferase-like isoleucine patch superfamily enzyme
MAAPAFGVRHPQRTRPLAAELRAVEPRIHPRALCESADLGTGVVVEAGAFVGAGACLAAGCRIGPSAWVEGAVGERAQIGRGALVAAGVRVGARAIVRAGSIVLRDVAPGAVVEGDPAQPFR